MAIEKIIVLEDEAVIRKHLTELLQRKNFLVAQADSVSKAKQLVDKDDFDMIFADVRLPDGHGTEVLEYCQLKATPPLVALMTAYASVESAVECMQGGACDDLIKHVNFIIDNSYIKFDDKCYRQIIGIPMGTNCAPHVANIFLHVFEYEFIDDLILESLRDITKESEKLITKYMKDYVM